MPKGSQGDSQLVKGTSIVAVTGVLFDLWVSLFMAKYTPNEKTVRIVSLIFAVILVWGLWMMYTGFKADNENN
jgi:flagellar biosynthesis protein FliQ